MTFFKFEFYQSSVVVVCFFLFFLGGGIMRALSGYFPLLPCAPNKGEGESQNLGQCVQLFMHP